MTESAPIEPKKDLPAGQAGKKKGEWFYLLLILLLFGSNVAFGWLWWKDKGKLQIITVEKESVSDKAEIVKQELIALQAQYQNMSTSNTELQKEIDSKKDEIAQLQRQLERHKDDAYIIARLKKETQTLRAIMQHFVHEIDSLHTLNNTVIAEREAVKGELKMEKEKTTQLTKDKESLQNTVNIASMLKAVSLSAKAMNEKRGGKKEVETKHAKWTDKIKISFTLAENTVARKGDRVVYARIVAPDGKELTQGDDSTHTFSFGKSRGFWATKKTVNYANENTEVIMYAHTKPGEPFLNGKYVIEVATDGVPIGSTTLDLQ